MTVPRVTPPRITEWDQKVPDQQWQVYQRVIDQALARKIPIALGGAFALATYTGCWRNTKDLDLYVLPQYKDAMIQVLSDIGLQDYYDTKPYDRWWIYRGFTGDTIVDVIWAMANHRQQIDQLWMSGPEVDLHGRTLKVLPAEAMFWDKLYIMQRDRCDWPDVLNLLYAVGPLVDWQYLLCRVGEDVPLVAGVLSVFRWISPGRAEELPGWVWEHVGLQPAAGTAAVDTDSRRVSLLDTRRWYGPDLDQVKAA